MRSFNDLTGKKFGDLRVIAYAGTDKHRRRRWRVYCERCTRVKRVLAANLLSGRTKNCGCVSAFRAWFRMKSWSFAQRIETLCAKKGMTPDEVWAELMARRAKGLNIEEAFRALESTTTKS